MNSKLLFISGTSNNSQAESSSDSEDEEDIIPVQHINNNSADENTPPLPVNVVDNNLDQLRHVPQTGSRPMTGNGFVNPPEIEMNQQQLQRSLNDRVPPILTAAHESVQPSSRLLNGQPPQGRVVTNRGSRGSSPITVKQEAVKQEPKTTEPVWSKEELRCVYIRNQNMRHMIFKEVKRPGKDYSRLFDMLRQLHGPVSVRRAYIQDVMDECKRFKRGTLLHCLEQQMDDLTNVSKI